MWRHSKFRGTFYGNYEYAKNGKRVLFLEKFSTSGKKISSKKFTSWQSAKKAGWVRA